MIRSRRRSVLIAVHDRALSRLLRLHLERAGFLVFAAFDSEQAGILAARQRYELMIADLDLPPKGGFEFCCFVREELGLTDVSIAVCCTGKTDLSASELVYKYGISKLLMKPIDAEAVVEFARETVDSLLATT